MKEIGGYLELEELKGEDHYPKLLHLNLGRTALLFALEILQAEKLFLPRFLCDSVTEICRKWGKELHWYQIDENFTPILEKEPREGEYVYLVNYYGQLTDQRIRAYQKKYGFVLVDHTHAFYQRPLKDIPTLYSPRKFFGLPDGGLLSLPADVAEKAKEEYQRLERDCSGVRMKHILGRYEQDASGYYQDMLASAHGFGEETVKKMSKITGNLLKAIDYERAKEKRNQNYEILQSLLDEGNRQEFQKPEGPFVYPYRVPGGQELRRRLAAEKIYVPLYWSNVLRDMPEESTEYQMAANILPLPCDQRYGPEEMERLAETVKKFQERGE